MRHSTNRSQRSERALASQPHATQSNGNQFGFASQPHNNHNVTASDHFDHTDYNVSEKSQPQRSENRVAEETDEFIGYDKANEDTRMIMQNQF